MNKIEDPFGSEAHDRDCPTHNKLHGHYCAEFDGLWICEDCAEWDCCTCFGSHEPRHPHPPMKPEDLDKL